MEFLDIGQVVQRSGVSASTLRYYEAKGLITSLGRSGLRRQFGSDVLERLGLIALGQTAGFALDEIGQMLGAGGTANISRPMLLAKADEIERSIRLLRVLSQGLRHAAACQAPSHLECPTFQGLVKKAAAGALGGRKKMRPLP